MSTSVLSPPMPPKRESHDAAVARSPISTTPASGHGTFRRVVIVFALAFLGLEVFTRAVLFPASKDFSRFATYPTRAAALVEQPGMRIAFIGNSLTGEGIDPKLLSKSLEEAGAGPVTADLFTADASKINVWHYLANHYFWKHDRHPDLIVVPFYETNLIDGHPLEMGRFAQFFVETADWPEVFAHDVTSAADRLEFLLSSGWATFAARDRIKERVLSLLVPHYQQLVAQTHAAQHVKPAPGTASSSEKPATHQMLQRFLARASEHHTRVVFVAFPTIVPGRERPYQPYELNPETLRLIGDAGMEFLDLRQVPELTPDMYADDIHLNAVGRPIFSRKLAQELWPILQRQMALIADEN